MTESHYIGEKKGDFLFNRSRSTLITISLWSSIHLAILPNSLYFGFVHTKTLQKTSLGLSDFTVHAIGGSKKE